MLLLFIQVPKFQSPPIPRKALLCSELSAAARAPSSLRLRVVLPQVLQPLLRSTRRCQDVCCESQETRYGKFINMPWMVYGKRL